MMARGRWNTIWGNRFYAPLLLLLLPRLLPLLLSILLPLFAQLGLLCAHHTEKLLEGDLTVTVAV